MQKRNNFLCIQHGPCQIGSAERTCLSTKIHISSSQFDQTPHQLFKVRGKWSFLHKFCPWGLFQAGPTRRGWKSKKPSQFAQPGHPPSASRGAPGWSPHAPPYPNTSQRTGYPPCGGKEGGCSFSRQIIHKSYKPQRLFQLRND